MPDQQSEQAVRRERELQRRSKRKTRPPLTAPFDTQLVGVTFAPGYPDRLRAVCDWVARPHADRGTVWIELRHDRNNRYDPNAVAAYVHGVPDVSAKERLGHLNRVIASRLAPELDAKIAWTARAVEGGGDPPGLTIRALRKGRKTRPPRVGHRRRRDARRRAGMKTR